MTRALALPALVALSCASLLAFATCGGDDDEGSDDPCDGLTCSGHGTCDVDDAGDPFCDCDEGFVADDETCVSNDPACADNDCDPNATCAPATASDDGGYTCACNPGYEGDGTTCSATSSDVDPGTPCDPDAETTACAGACSPIGDSGLCTDACSDDADCPHGWRCDPDYAPEGEAGLCLPNASCGALTYAGECDGTTLRYCGFDGPAEVDCAQDADANGKPLACGEVSADVGFDCVSADFTGGCGEVSFGGACNGNTLTYCESAESGNVVTVDCTADGLVCVAADDSADCVAEGTSGCGDVGAIGTCDGTTATWCQDFAVKSEDCAASGKVCGGDGDSYRCVTPVASGGSATVSGTFVYEKKALTQDGLGAVSHAPVRGALVTVRSAADDARVAQGYSDDSGAFSLSFDASGEVYVLVTAQGEPGLHNHSVRDCAMEDCAAVNDGLGNVYGFKTDGFAPAAGTTLGEQVITVDSGLAGAFNIHELMVRGADFAKQNFGRYPPTLTVEWKRGSNTPGGTSYFSGEDGKIFILGGADDTDEYDDPVLLHEYGHYLEFYLSHSDSPGGSHDGTPTDPRLAWGKGLGTYVGCTIAGSPLYIDTSAAGASVEDVRTAGDDVLASLNDPHGMKQVLSEMLVSQILWTIANGPHGNDGKGTEPTFDVLGHYFTSSTAQHATRGVAGLDLVDYLDGWFCKQHGDRPFIEAIVNGTAKFPYDYAGPASCN